ncbi:hypothetical protein WA588_003330 [Blastocystis sp. NMH]
MGKGQKREASSENEVKTEEKKQRIEKPKKVIEYTAEDIAKMSDEELRAKVPPEKWNRPVRLYADGIFDLFHYGHARALEQAKKSFPNTYLMVGCCNDELTHRMKGMTVMTDKERYESLRHCKWVDEVIPDAPWVVTKEFLDKHKIDFVCHDDIPYASAGSNDVYADIKNMGRFHATKRTEGVSTTELINRIIANYEKYIRRNLERGVSAKDMNISYMKEQTIKFDMMWDKWMEKTKSMRPGFLEFFDRNMFDSFKEAVAGLARQSFL